MFANNHEVVCSETCLNRSYSKAKTLLRRTDTFDPVCFLYAFLSRIFKVKNCKEDTSSEGWHFQSSDKKAHYLPYADTNKSFRNFWGTENSVGHFWQFSQKETFFYTLKQQKCFFGFNLQFWRSATLLTWTLYLLFLLCSQLAIVFAPMKAISTFKPYYTPCELLVSVLWLTLSFGKVSKTCRRMH